MLNTTPLLPCSREPNNFYALTPANLIIKEFDNFKLGDLKS